MKAVSIALKNWLVHKYNVADTATEDELRNKTSEAIAKSALSIDEFNRLQGEPSENLKSAVSSIVKQTVAAMNGGGTSMSTKTNTTPEELFGGGNGNVRVKAGSERYSHTKATAVHTKTGQPMFDERGRQATVPSEVECAFAGVWLKETARRSGMAVNLNDHEKQLLGELFEKHTFCGEYNGQFVDSLDGLSVKTLLNDVTSGGVSIVPAFVDADLISFPLLHSEIFPLVDLRPVPKGNSVEGGSISNPTVTWGVGEGTHVSLFNTDDMIDAINSSIHPVACAIEVGRDFLSDAVADVGRVLMTQIGEKMAAELDRVVVAGNGTSEPEGISVASGLASVNSTNNTTGPATLADYLSLMFAIGKQYRTAAMRCAYLTNDTTYQRSRNIKVDPATPSTDQRPLFGVDNVQNYMTLGVQHKIQNDLANTRAIFGAMSKYRVYRRQGAETQWVDGGAELARKNCRLLMVRARFGGRVVDASAFAKCVDMQS